MLLSHGASLAFAAALFGSTTAAAISIRRDVVDLQPRGSRWTPTHCSPLELIHFLSAYEKHGESLGVFGEPLYKEILKYVPDATAHDVPYNTELLEEVFTPMAAGMEATKWINRRAAQCPHQRYIVAGYSKGTIPVHVTYPDPEVRPRVVASLVVGDLMGRNSFWPITVFNTSWPSNGDKTIVTLCNVGDQICDPTGHEHEIHLHPHYLPRIPAAVERILKLYRKNKKAPFPYVRTKANFVRPLLHIL